MSVTESFFIPGLQQDNLEGVLVLTATELELELQSGSFGLQPFII